MIKNSDLNAKIVYRRPQKRAKNNFLCRLGRKYTQQLVFITDQMFSRGEGGEGGDGEGGKKKKGKKGGGKEGKEGKGRREWRDGMAIGKMVEWLMKNVSGVGGGVGGEERREGRRIVGAMIEMRFVVGGGGGAEEGSKYRFWKGEKGEVAKEAHFVFSHAQRMKGDLEVKIPS